ncbi:glycosyltransferase family 15 protein [Amanita thiersii Skay4041]|uniref:Glycosyltransferase family 15 protein n=1 Tax=Amanita thiersii Skay4041 TaxID=703135 RepID=A0A2A9NBU9_9AGAR|nr:glycosyltransferase family 15 protein [Amanita thiersii Skay4041]
MIHLSAPARYLILALSILLGLHWILALTHEEYGRATSLSTLISGSNKPHRPDENLEQYYYTPPTPDPDTETSLESISNVTHLLTDTSRRRANATLLMLARNGDVDGAVRSVREMEDRFNRRFGYPYVFLNEEPFSEEFKKRVSVLSNAPMEFGLIPHDHWYQPNWIDEPKAEAARKKMENEQIIYGGSVSYRNMCRFNSGFFFKHPLVQQYRWYWRIEPDVHFHCDVQFDPFLYMEDHDKVYSFTIAMYEFEATIPTLWQTVTDFKNKHPEFIAKDNAMNFLSDNGGERYNLCHFWSNFEIADMEFWRGPAYTAFFEHLESTGGFYYERWGDAPVHSIAAALFARKDQIHFWDEIGYEHNPYTHCPQSEANWKRGKCSCNQQKSFDYDGYSCMMRWDQVMGWK